jgi:hypothetical protein
MIMRFHIVLRWSQFAFREQFTCWGKGVSSKYIAPISVQLPSISFQTFGRLTTVHFQDVGWTLLAFQFRSRCFRPILFVEWNRWLHWHSSSVRTCENLPRERFLIVRHRNRFVFVPLLKCSAVPALPMRPGSIIDFADSPNQSRNIR